MMTRTAEQTVFLDVDMKTKEEALQFIAAAAQRCGVTTDAAAYAQAMAARERETTTGFGFGMAIPHAKIPEIREAAIFVLRLRGSVEWGALDGQPVHMIIALAVPDAQQGDTHLKLLSGIARRMMHSEFRDTLKNAATPQAIADLLGQIQA